MPQQPDPADRGPDEDLAWLDRDPMTAEERAAWLDRVCEFDEPPPEDEEYEDFAPLTAAELAEIREAAADDPVDHTGRPDLHHRTRPLPGLGLAGWLAEANGVTLSLHHTGGRHQDARA